MEPDNREMLEELTGMSPAELARCEELELIELTFDMPLEDALVRGLRRIRRLQQDLEIPVESIEVVLHLIDQLEDMQPSFHHEKYVHITVVDE